MTRDILSLVKMFEVIANLKWNKELDLSEFTLSEYETIITCYIASYLRVHPKKLSRKDWSDLVIVIPLCEPVLNKMLDLVDKDDGNFNYISLKVNGTVIDLTDLWYNYDLFDCIVQYALLNRTLDKIRDESTNETLNSNIKHLYEALDQIQNMNTNSGAFECMQNDSIAKIIAPQTFATFQPNQYVDYLTLISSYDFADNELGDLAIVYRILKYELKIHANSMYLIIVLQLIKHASCSSDSIQSIGTELYDNFHYLLQDGRLLSIQTNHLFQDSKKSYEFRTKNTDNTTRLHLLFGFDNYDSYSLRLDLSHEGIDWIHYNQTTPGGVKSNFFSAIEYENILRYYPTMDKCFINYEDRWFLKERSKCLLSSEEQRLFEKIEMLNAHPTVFMETHSEESVLSFLSVLNSFLMPIVPSNVDKSGNHAKYVFNLDKLMLLSKLYWLSKLQNASDTVKNIETQIVTKGINYGIIKPSDKELFSSEEGILYVIDSAFERCFPGSKFIEN